VNVSACLVTRGDVDLEPIIASIPQGWEILIWDNGCKMIHRSDGWAERITDLSVYGRYAAIEYASHDLIFVQDDDVIVSDPQAIVDAWIGSNGPFNAGAHIVCNMPPEFRPHYPDSGLVGFGASFHRDAPQRAFDRFSLHYNTPDSPRFDQQMLYRRADNLFTVLTPRVLVDVPKTDCSYASDPNRMWRQQGHTSERDAMIRLARQVRDGQ
jgi:hypothetical protein